MFSSTAATLVRTVPAVVAMQFAVTDDAAAVFSRAFYQALVRNRGVDEAVRAARIALTGWNPDTLEWVTPVLYLRSRDSRLFDLTYPGASPARADEQPEPRQEAVLAAYWAARSTGDWEPVITQLAALHRQLPADREVEQAYQYARLAFRYEQGHRAEQEQDWPSAAAHYQAVSDAQPEYRDVAARLAEVSRRRPIAALQEQLRALFAFAEFQAVVGIADRLAELDPAAADPDGLTIRARRRLEQQTDHIVSAEFTRTEGPGRDTGPWPVLQATLGHGHSPHFQARPRLDRPHRLRPGGGVQPGWAAAGQLRRRQDGAAVGPGRRRAPPHPDRPRRPGTADRGVPKCVC